MNETFGRGPLIRYSGEWLDGVYDGKGRLYKEICSDSTKRVNLDDESEVNTHWIKYTGGFKNGAWHGPGELVFSNGERLEAEWCNGVLTKNGKLYQNNGKVRDIAEPEEEEEESSSHHCSESGKEEEKEEEMQIEKVVKHVMDNAGEYPVLVEWLENEEPERVRELRV